MPSYFLNPSQKKLALAAGIAAWLVIVLALLAIFSNTLQILDQNIEKFLSFARRPAMNGFFLAVTYLGSVQFIIFSLIFLSAIFAIRKDLPRYCILLGTMLGASASVFIIKNFVERTRPESALYMESSFSFPSGHTAISVVFFGMLAYLASKSTPRAASQINIFFAWIFVMIMIGFSRMYLGVHFASDVLAGYAIGFFWLCIGINFFEGLSFDKERWWKKIFRIYSGRR